MVTRTQGQGNSVRAHDIARVGAAHRVAEAVGVLHAAVRVVDARLGL